MGEISEDTSRFGVPSEGMGKRNALPPFRRRVRWVLPLGVAAIGILLVGWLSSGYLLARLAESFLPANVQLTGIALTLNGAIRIGQIQIADARGVWLEINGLRAEPAWSRMIRGERVLNRLDAQSVQVHRRPVPKMPLRVPVIPGWHASPSCDHLEIGRITLREQVAGYEAAYRVAGKLERGNDGKTGLYLHLTDDHAREIALTIADAVSPATSSNSSEVTLTCEGQDGQVLPMWLGRTDPVTVRLTGAGRRDQWNAEIYVCADSEATSAMLHLKAKGYETVQYAVDGEFKGRIGVLPEHLAEDGKIRIALKASLDAAGNMHIADATVTSDLVTLNAKGMLHTTDWTGEGESTVTTPDLRQLLERFADTPKSPDVQISGEAVSAYFSGSISRQPDGFRVVGEGSVGNTPILTLLLERTWDGLLRGEGRMDVDRIPLPETWRTLAGGGAWTLAASGGGNETAWRIENISLKSPVWQIDGAVSGTGWDLKTVQVNGELSCAFSGIQCPWGNLENGRGHIRFSGGPEAMTVQTKSECERWAWSGMSMAGINAEVSGVINLRKAGWADRVQRLEATASAKSWTLRESLPAPACQITLSPSDDGTMQFSGHVQTDDHTAATLSGTWKPDTGALDLNGTAQVDLIHVAPWISGAHDYHIRGAVSAIFHVTRAAKSAPLDLIFSAESSDLDADLGYGPLNAFLPAVERRLSWEGQIQFAENAITGDGRLLAPSRNLEIAKFNMELDRASKDWTLEMESESVPIMAQILLSDSPAVPSWFFTGKYVLQLEARGSGGMSPEEAAGVLSWTTGDGDLFLQAAAAGVRLRRNGMKWEGNACLLTLPRGIQQPLGISGVVTLNGSQADIRKARAGVVAPGWWKLRDRITLTDNPAFSQTFGELDAKLQPGDVSGTLRLRDVLVPALLAQVERGTLSGEIGLGYTGGKTRVTADLTVQDIATGGIQADTGKSTFTWERGENRPARWRGRLEIASGKAGTAGRLEKQVLTLETSDSAENVRWTFSGNLTAGSIPADYQLEGAVDPAFTSLTVEKGQGHILQESWLLAKPAVIRRNPENIILESARVEMETGGYLEGEGRWQQGTVSGHLGWNSLSLTSLGKVQAWTGFQGTCRGQADFSGIPGDIQGNLDLVLDARPPGHDSDSTGVTVILALCRQNGGLTSWKGEMVGRGLDKPFHAEIEGEGMSRFGLRPFAMKLIPAEDLASRITFSGDLGYAGLFTGQDQFSLKGSIAGAITWKRSKGGPDMSGNITIRDGYFEDYRFGTVLGNITCDAQTDGNTVRVTRFSAEDGRGGTLQGGGTLKGGESFLPEMDLHIDLNRLRVLRMDYAAAMVSGRLNLMGPITSPLISGGLTLDQGVIETAMSTPAGKPQENTITVERQYTVTPNDPAERGVPANTAKSQQYSGDKSGARPKFWSQARCDIPLEIPGQLVIRSPVLQSVWQGHIQVFGPLGDLHCQGGLEIVRGSLNFFGKRLDLADSWVTMNEEDLYRPHLSIRASGDSGDTAVRLALEGEPDNMELTVNATPPLPPEEALSRLLFRRGTGQVSPLQALQVARAASLLGRQFTLLQFLGGSFRIPGMDAFDIRTGDTLAETSVGVGRSIGDRVYVQAEQGLTPSSGKVSAEVEVTPNIRVKVDAGANESGGGGVFWKKEY